MTYLESAVLVLHVLTAVAVCGFVLLQHGKGADMGAAFGSGASGSLFGAVGSANFLSRTTAVLATVFFLSSLGLTYYASNRGAPKDAMKQGVMQSLPEKSPKAADGQPPAAPTSQPAAPAAPTKDTNSKAGEVPK